MNKYLLVRLRESLQLILDHVDDLQSGEIVDIIYDLERMVAILDHKIIEKRNFINV